MVSDTTVDTTSPSVLVTFQPGFESLAERDIRAASPKSKVLSQLEPGLWHVRGDLVAGLASAIAIRHLHPVMVDAPVSDLAALVAAVAPLGAALNRNHSYAVQTRLVGSSPIAPKAIPINDAVAAAIDAPYDRRAPAQVLSVTLVGERVLAGVGPTRDNLSAWPGGARRFAHAAASPSRAEHKLEEALEVFGYTPRGRALDLGAAPGGWTKVLAERGVQVTAIDPAELDRNITTLPGVSVYRGTAERYLSSRAAPVDLIVNDMRMDARDAARLLLDFKKLLAHDGRLLTTLKLPERGYLAVLDAAFDILGQGYERVAARQLFHNRSEVTALLRPR